MTPKLDDVLANPGDMVKALREALALVAKATAGPWHVETDAGVTMTTGANNEDVCDNTDYYPGAVKPADQYAIAAAVNWLREHGPALLASQGASETVNADTPILVRHVLAARSKLGPCRPDVHDEDDAEEAEHWDMLTEAARVLAAAPTPPTTPQGEEPNGIVVDSNDGPYYVKVKWRGVVPVPGTVVYTTPQQAEGRNLVLYTADEVREAWQCLRRHNRSIPDECLDQMRDVLTAALAEQQENDRG